MKEIWWSALEGVAKVSPWVAGAFALAGAALVLVLAFIGLLAVSDGWWSFGVFGV